MAKLFHADGNKQSRFVVVWGVDVGVGRIFCIDVGILYKHELLFGLWDGLAPKVHVKSCGHSTEETNKVVFPSLDGLLCGIFVVVIGGN